MTAPTLSALRARGEFADVKEVAAALDSNYMHIYGLCVRYDQRVSEEEKLGPWACPDEVYRPLADEIPCVRVGKRIKVVLDRLPQLRRVPA